MSDADREFEPVIGLEVHVQLATATKLFCGCKNAYGAEPNTQICAVCSGQPGVLPVLNRQALELAIRAGLVLGCAVAPRTKFDRKNYFYPDLPKGYQISQFDQPVNRDGGIDVLGDDGAHRRIGIVRAHLEEDAGKTIHPEGMAFSLVDLNRCGIPLLEIVSAPDLRSAREAHRYLDDLKRLLRYARVSECDMEKGSLRCDANVSVRPRGSQELRTRAEVKNLNSFRNVERAIDYEIERQTALWRAGGKVTQETRSWRDDEGRTEPLRSKEEAHDYRYFPEPDLPEFEIDGEWIERLRGGLPELPAARRSRYVERFALSEQTAEVLVAERATAEYFEQCVALGGADPREIANFVMGPVLAEVNERGVSAAESRIPPATLVDVVKLVAEGRLSNQAARTKVLPAVIASGKDAAEVLKESGLEQISDKQALCEAVEQAIVTSPRAVVEYHAGKQNALNALVGAVMKATQGKANPNLVRELLAERLAQGDPKPEA